MDVGLASGTREEAEENSTQGRKQWRRINISNGDEGYSTSVFVD